MNRLVNVGVAARIGTYSDAAEVVDGTRVLYTAGTPGLDAVSGAVPEGFTEQAELAWKIDVVYPVGFDEPEQVAYVAAGGT